MAAADKPDRGWGDSVELTAVPDAAPLPARRLLIAGLSTAGFGLLALWVVFPQLLQCSSRRAPGQARLHGAARSPAQRPEPAPRTSDQTDDPTAAARSAPTPEQLVAEARRVAEQLLRELPDQPPALLLAGRIYYAFNDVSRADTCWTSCLERSPDFAEAHCAIGEAAWEHGEFQRAAEHLQHAFTRDPQLDQKQVYFLADALLNLGRAPDAVAALERSAQHRTLPPFGLFLLGHGYQEVGDYEQACTQFRAVLTANPQSANAHFGLASACARLGRTEEARQHREAYARLRHEELADSARLRPEMRKRDWADPIPVVRECYLNAGKLYVTYGRLAEAEEHWRRAAELDPQDQRARELLDLLPRSRSGPAGRP
jgi:tetratricopeptide (TPR) repeat protein